MTTPSTASEVEVTAADFEVAAEYITNNGWCRGGLFESRESFNEDEDGYEILIRLVMQRRPACMMGGMVAALIQRVPQSRPTQLFWRLVTEELRKDLGSSPTHFNDNIAKGKEDVIDQLMVTAKRLRNEGR